MPDQGFFAKISSHIRCIATATPSFTNQGTIPLKRSLIRLLVATLVASALFACRPRPGIETESLAAVRTPAGTNTPLPSIPGANPTPTLSTGPVVVYGPHPLPTTVHTIQQGETLLGIALQYGTSVELLVLMNGLENPEQIRAGDTLIVPQPTAVPTRDPAAPAATYPPPPGQVNSIPYSTILYMPEEVRQRAREIFVHGQTLGNNPRAFSKVGDSTIENPFFLARFDAGPYDLGAYVYLQGTIDYFSGSFARDSIAVRVGMHSWSATDPQWADKALCQPNETVVACEFRVHRPAVALIRLGSNDAGVPESFRQNMQAIIDLAISKGVIPVLGTKADRHEGGDTNNQIIRELAAANRIPLWDYDAVAATLPGRGLDVDHVHMTTFYLHDYTLPGAFESGHSAHNLTALIVLDLIRTQIME